MIRRRVVVRGIVQGVFFRDACRKEARRRGICGWVTNRDDGAVEAVFEGDDSAVEAMLDWARSGPPQAEVRDIQVSDEDPQGESEFRVRS